MRVLLALITVGVTIYGLIDCFRSTDAEVRYLPRSWWLLITLVPLAGGLAWLTFGRAPGEQGAHPAARPVAPDDDPEFLRSLDRSFREHRRQAAEDARRRRRAEEASRQAEAEEASREAEEASGQAEQEARRRDPRHTDRPSSGDGDERGQTPA